MAVIVIPEGMKLPEGFEKTFGVKALNNLQGLIVFDRTQTLNPWVMELERMGHARCDRGVPHQNLGGIPEVHEKLIKAREMHQNVFAIIPDKAAKDVVKKVKSKLNKECSLYTG